MPATSQNAAVAALWRYPVKSMMGEELNAAVVTAGGLLGDRAYALIDRETGKVVSAKNPKKWPDFFAFRAAYLHPPETGAELPPVWITLPDGGLVRSDAGDVEAQLSAATARAVGLERQAPRDPRLEQYWPEHEGQAEDVTQEAVAGAAPEGSFFDYATVHILTTSTLDRLRELYPQGRIEARRFRPNLVIQTEPGLADFVENAWVGKELRIGEVRLRVTDPCPRCVMPTLAQGDLPRDPGLLRAIGHNTVHVPFADRALPSIGVYAQVVQGGTVRRRDAVVVE